MQKRKGKKLPEIIEVFPEFKEAVVEFINGNLCDMSLDTAHDYMNKYLNVIMEKDELFQSEIKMENKSDNNNDASIAIQVGKLRKTTLQQVSPDQGTSPSCKYCKRLGFQCQAGKDGSKAQKYKLFQSQQW
eukprot:15309275-Ditylum_brightwellii.AAC.1